MIEQGRDELTDALRREGLPIHEVWKSSQLEKAIGELS